jgi:integrase
VGNHKLIFKEVDRKINYRFCDLISSHTMRRTAITTMLRMGMNETNVRLISGHAAHSPSFYRYVFYADSFMEEEMDKQKVL